MVVYNKYRVSLVVQIGFFYTIISKIPSRIPGHRQELVNKGKLIKQEPK